MLYSSLITISVASLLALDVSARPDAQSTHRRHHNRMAKVVKREVPQEHSHQPFLASVAASVLLNNPQNLPDSVFGLLGNAAIEKEDANVDPECLQTLLADQAFTNAKAAGDVTAMTDALIYRALERNTGSVGLQSNACVSVTPVNPEIAALSQHQDPASTGAAATNKAIALALAQQIASIGGNPQDALKSGTFAPGQIGDPTGAGNTCDVATDVAGCIFSQNLLVDDATADEINAAVAGISASGAASNVTASANATAAVVACASANVTAAADTEAKARRTAAKLRLALRDAAKEHGRL